MAGKGNADGAQLRAAEAALRKRKNGKALTAALAELTGASRLQLLATQANVANMVAHLREVRFPAPALRESWGGPRLSSRLLRVRRRCSRVRTWTLRC